MASIASLKAIYTSVPSRAVVPIVALSSVENIGKFATDEALSDPVDLAISYGLNCIYAGKKPLEGNVIDKRLGMLTAEFKDASGDKYAKVLFLTSVGQVDSFIKNIEKCQAYYVELVMCHQVKALNRSNLINYFKSYGVTISSTDSLFKILKAAAGTTDMLVGDKDLRDIARQNKFVAYHTNYASSGGLIIKAYTECRILIEAMITDEEYKSANASSDSPWDMDLNSKITSRSIVVAYAYLDASGTLPDNWYQGTRAYEEAATAYKRALKTVFKKFMSLAVVTDEIDASKTIDELLANLPGIVKK